MSEATLYRDTSLIRGPAPPPTPSGAESLSCQCYEDPRPHGMGMCGSHFLVPVFTEILQESFDPSGVTPVTVQ